ncbi:hypothetical protein Rhe02_34440 [Rhizocola hellebori]|uniref:Uncharacterized protein n=2 Tax=Rhizocola hellebori TaxID=1392758 RepID=A0A8J3Q8Y1_9ACTN|nr:hypothetical protein Rhe02_34440 [Rhizocola hellebori]
MLQSGLEEADQLAGIAGFFLAAMTAIAAMVTFLRKRPSGDGEPSQREKDAKAEGKTWRAIGMVSLAGATATCGLTVVSGPIGNSPPPKVIRPASPAVAMFTNRLVIVEVDRCAAYTHPIDMDTIDAGYSTPSDDGGDLTIAGRDSCGSDMVITSQSGLMAKADSPNPSSSDCYQLAISRGESELPIHDPGLTGICLITDEDQIIYAAVSVKSRLGSPLQIELRVTLWP